MRPSLLNALIFTLALSFLLPAACFGQQTEYKRVKIDKANCDIGVLYKLKADGADIGVSAIATGYGSEFRKWIVSDIRLNIDGKKIRPNTQGKFFVNKESLFRVPAAVVFAVIGAQIPAGGSDLQKGITRTGAAAGLGILALTAEGDIPGLKCSFSIDKCLVNQIVDGRDKIEITVEHPATHVKERIKIGLLRPEPSPRLIPDESMMQPSADRTLEEKEGIAKDIEIEAGKRFKIVLDSNRTTGYQWQLGHPLDDNVVSLVESKYITPKSDLMGAPGKEEWTFKATGPGQARIDFIYIRPWEKDRPPAESQSYIVTVK